MHYENHIIYCANNKIQIVCYNYETEEEPADESNNEVEETESSDESENETAEDVRNLYYVLKQIFEKKMKQKEHKMLSNITIIILQIIIFNYED